MIVAGIDMSENSPGVYRFELDKDYAISASAFLAFNGKNKKQYPGLINYDKNLNFYDQCNLLHDHIFEFVKDAEYVAFENYAYGGSGDMTGLGETTGILRNRLYLHGKKIRIYDIQGIKIFATSAGNVKKEHMRVAFDNEVDPFRCEISAIGSDKVVEKIAEDIVDSYWIARLLHTEIQLRTGAVTLRQLPENKIRVFNRTTKTYPTNILDTEFLVKK